MTFRMPLVRFATFLAMLLLVFATSFSSQAQTTKRRAVQPGSGQPPAGGGAGAPSATVTLTGFVLDSATGAPIVNVEVTSGPRSGRTDTQGKFTIKLVPGTNNTLRFARSGYETFETSVNITTDGQQNFRLIARPTVKVRMTNGTVYEIDTDTVEFGYVAPFSGYNKDSKLNLCKGGGEAFQPDRTEIKRITTGVQLNDAKCCATGSIPAINVELKSGSTTTAAFTDACLGYKVDVIALDHTSAQPVYLHFVDIAEVTFP